MRQLEPTTEWEPTTRRTRIVDELVHVAEDKLHLFLAEDRVDSTGELAALPHILTRLRHCADDRPAGTLQAAEGVNSGRAGRKRPSEIQSRYRQKILIGYDALIIFVINIVSLIKFSLMDTVVVSFCGCK